MLILLAPPLRIDNDYGSKMTRLPNITIYIDAKVTAIAFPAVEGKHAVALVASCQDLRVLRVNERPSIETSTMSLTRGHCRLRWSSSWRSLSSPNHAKPCERSLAAGDPTSSELQLRSSTSSLAASGKRYVVSSQRMISPHQDHPAGRGSKQVPSHRLVAARARQAHKTCTDPQFYPTQAPIRVQPQSSTRPKAHRQHPTSSLASGLGTKLSSSEIKGDGSRCFIARVQERSLAKDLGGVWRILQEAEQADSSGVSVNGYNACIGAMAKGKRWKDALRLLERMRKSNVEPDFRSFDRVIDACCRAGRFHQAALVRQEMLSVGVTPGLSCFRAELEHCGSAGCWERTLELLKEMKSIGVKLNAKAYNAAMDSFAYSKEWKLAAELLREMRDVGFELHTRSYRGAVVSAANAGACSQALILLEEMKSSGVEASAARRSMHNAVALACGMAGLWEESIAVLEDMNMLGMTPNVKSYNAALAACGKSGRWREALDLLHEMPAADVRPDEYSFTSVIDVCGKSKEWGRALALLTDMRAAGMTPGVVTFNAVISACGQGGQWDHALDNLEEMILGGVVPDEATYTSTLLACEAGGDLRKAAARLKAMAVGGDTPGGHTVPEPIVARLAITVCGRARDWDGALGVLRRAHTVSRVTTSTYNAAIWSLVPPERA